MEDTTHKGITLTEPMFEGSRGLGMNGQVTVVDSSNEGKEARDEKEADLNKVGASAGTIPLVLLCGVIVGRDSVGQETDTAAATVSRAPDALKTTMTLTSLILEEE
eukprot:CAMPEP_0172489736 /NCGR_PEP_ID=MMETSP1066-20121228/19941_1 /TAXON_ID=671091 /ORGANISM="Coscinodiscus wailesii, Strain CCMP2513" /LENGTH=105 /DNA_ID=CAMNT_0013257817 /DNA_START=277 /DNA_END=592 /DNA_ORIENTATION=-